MLLILVLLLLSALNPILYTRNNCLITPAQQCGCRKQWTAPWLPPPVLCFQLHGSLRLLNRCLAPINCLSIPGPTASLQVVSSVGGGRREYQQDFQLLVCASGYLVCLQHSLATINPPLYTRSNWLITPAQHQCGWRKQWSMLPLTLQSASPWLISILHLQQSHTVSFLVHSKQSDRSIPQIATCCSVLPNTQAIWKQQ